LRGLVAGLAGAGDVVMAAGVVTFVLLAAGAELPEHPVTAARTPSATLAAAIRRIGSSCRVCPLA
jgi:hypothetical protein